MDAQTTNTAKKNPLQPAGPVAQGTAKTAEKESTPRKAGGGWRDFEKRHDDVTRADVYKVPLSLIKVKKGFNPRDLDKPETRAKIDSIKESYKAGRYVKPLEVSLEDGDALLVDGECRFTAALKANKELKEEGKPEISHLICIPFKGDSVDRLVHTVFGNEGEKLTQMEQAEVVRRLTKEQKWSREDVAKRMQWSISWVDKLIVLSKMAPEVKQLVIDGKVAPDVASDYHKKFGENAYKELMNLLSGAGGAKVTKKDTKKEKAEGEESEPKPKSEKQLIKERTIEIGQDLAHWLPEFPHKKSQLKLTEEYPVKLTGRVIKMLKELQDMYYVPEESEEE